MVINLELLGQMTLLTALGFIGNGYRFYAGPRGWPVSNLFSGGPEEKFTMANASVLFVPMMPAFAWYKFGVWFGLGVLFCAFVLAWLLTEALRQYVQWFWCAALAAVVGYNVLQNAHKLM
jgi:hypothetical protein